MKWHLYWRCWQRYWSSYFNDWFQNQHHHILNMPIEFLIVLLILYSQSNRELGHLNRTIQMTMYMCWLGLVCCCCCFLYDNSVIDTNESVHTGKYFKEIIIIFSVNFSQVILIDSFDWMDACNQVFWTSPNDHWIVNYTHTHTDSYTKVSKWTVQHQLTYIALFQWNVSTSSNYIWFVFVLFEVDEISVCLWMAAWNLYTWWSFVQSNWSSSSNININVIIMDFCEMESV